MSLRTSRARALVLVVVAILLSTLALVGLPSRAGAVIALPDPSTALIDKDKKGSITVNKFLTSKPGTASNIGGGYPLDYPEDAKFIDDVNFKVEKVTDHDITTNEGFRKARELAEKQPKEAGPLKLEEIATKPTSFGTVTFDNLDPALYVVTELPSPNAMDEDGEKVVLNPSAPFFVFVPMTNESRDGWNYEVQVFPKNSTSTIDKEVKDAGKHVGNTLTYTIKSDVPFVNGPHPESGPTLSKYHVVDQLDPRLSEPKITVALSDGTPIGGDEYTVQNENNKITVEFNPSGLKKLAEAKVANNEIRVHTTIEAKIGPVGDGQGYIFNEASLIPNENASEGDIPSNRVVTRHGRVQVNKTFQGAEDLSQLKATFNVYECSADGKLANENSPITVDGKSEFTTENGVATIDGLQVNDFRDGASIEPAPERSHYCLVETETAEGYELLPQPIPFQVTDDTLGESGTLTIDVENVKTTGVTLPFTGGSGVGVLLGLGAVIVAGGVFLAVRTSRKKARG